MYYSRAVFKNIQRWKKITLDLSQGFNCIWGNNERGKSSIMRGFKWTLDNSPRGDWMIRRNRPNTKNPKPKTAEVKLIKNDIPLRRIKGNGINRYILDGVPFDDFGTKIPGKVKKFIGINNPLADLKLNPFAKIDDDPRFLVNTTSIKRARAINILVGTDTLEQTIKAYNIDKRTHNKNIKYHKELITQWEKDKKKFDVLDELEFNDANVLFKQLDKLEGKIKDITALNVIYKKNDIVVRHFERLNEIYKELYKSDCLIDNYKSIDNVIDRLQDLSKDYKANKKFVKPKDFDFKLIGDMLQDYKDKNDLIKLIEQNLDEFDDNVTKIHVASNKMKKNKKILKKFENTNCPICNRVIKKVKI